MATRGIPPTRSGGPRQAPAAVLKNIATNFIRKVGLVGLRKGLPYPAALRWGRKNPATTIPLITTANTIYFSILP